MKISTTARHCTLDPEDRLHATARLEKLQRFARDLGEAHLVLTAEKYRHAAEITLRLKHQEMIAREESTEPRVAIDRAVDHLEERLRRLKERRMDRTHRPANGRDGAAPESLAGELEEGEARAGEDTV